MARTCSNLGTQVAASLGMAILRVMPEENLVFALKQRLAKQVALSNNKNLIRQEITETHLYSMLLHNKVYLLILEML